jgi:DNA-binding response OmpR family regulator
MSRVLVVDDDPTVREVVVSYLRAEHYEVDEAADGESALSRVGHSRPDLVVLDVLLPGLDGLEVCRRIRGSTDIPIILLSALGSETDRVVGLEFGADDYLTKPFSPRELMLRVGSVLRRAGELHHGHEGELQDGDLVVDSGSRLVTRGGQAMALTSREFDLLAFFISNPGQVFSREELLHSVWGWSYGDHSTVTVHVRRLREKIEQDPSRPVRIETVWGVGYRWRPAPRGD